MLLRKIIISFTVALLIGMFGVEYSFDFENYTSYAGHPDAAAERFSFEPVFPLFILAASKMGLPPEIIIQAFITLGAMITVFAVITLSNRDKRYKLLRSLAGLVVSLPFILFGTIVPRQGLAVGLVLCAMLRVKRLRRIDDWKTLLLLGIAAITHGATAVFGSTLIFAGYVRPKTLTLLYIFLTTIILCVAVIDLKIFHSPTIAYEHYFYNFRDTGTGRLVLFLSVASAYFTQASRRVGGIFGNTAPRNISIALMFSAACTVLYFFVATDSIRLTYLLGIAMATEIVSKIRFWPKAFPKRTRQRPAVF